MDSASPGMPSETASWMGFVAWWVVGGDVSPVKHQAVPALTRVSARIVWVRFIQVHLEYCVHYKSATMFEYDATVIVII